MREKRDTAAAVEYHPGFQAPFVTARGKGAAARKMVEIADRYGIPVVRNDVLSEALCEIPPGGYVPEPFWRALAAVFVYIAEQEGRE